MLWSLGQVRATVLRRGMSTCSIFNTQDVATRHNRVMIKRAQHVAPTNFICCVQMLRSFGWSSSCKCWANNVGIWKDGDMSCWDVVIVWPGLKNHLNFSLAFLSCGNITNFKTRRCRPTSELHNFSLVLKLTSKGYSVPSEWKNVQFSFFFVTANSQLWAIRQRQFDEWHSKTIRLNSVKFGHLK